MAEKNSISNSGSKIAHLMHLIIILVAVSLVLMISTRIAITSLERVSSRLFQTINTIALAVQVEEDSPTESLLNAYDEYTGLRNELLDDLLTPGRHLVALRQLLPPDFSGVEERLLYRDEVVSYASYIRDQSYRAMNVLFYISYTLQGIMFLMVLAMYALFRIFRSSVDQSLEVMLHGVDIINTRLNYEKAEFYSLSEDAPQEVKKLGETISKINRDIVLDQYIDNIESYGGIQDILENLAPVIYRILPFDRIALAVNDQAGRVTAESAFTKYKKIYLEPGHSEFLTQSSLPRLLESGEGRIINDLPFYASGRTVSESTRLVLREGIQSSVSVPLMQGNRCMGFLFFSSVEKNVYEPIHIKIAQRIANRLKSRLYHEYMSQELIAETANAMVGLMDEKDNETSEHLSRMSRYAYIIARKLSKKDYSVSPGFPRELLWFAPLHDIGKISVPDNILLKPGALTPEEYSDMQKHVDTGLKIVEAMNRRMVNILNQSVLQTAEDIIRGHHEKYDGSGYPAGLKGRDIPLAGRIVAIADVFDALTSKRPYKEAFSTEKALEMMQNDMAGSFDPYLFGIFLESLDEIKEIMETFRE